MKHLSQALTQALISFDPIASAERVFPGDAEAQVTTAIFHSQLLRAHMNEVKDSHYGIDFSTMVKMALDEGFVEIFSKDVIDDSRLEPASETYLILFNHESGILLVLESYFNKSVVNTARMYYNIELRPDADLNCLSSFHMNGDVYICSHDVRVGFRHYLSKLRANGKFLSKWVERPFLWFLTFMDTRYRNYDHNVITESVIRQFPKSVIDAITPNQPGK